jgi:ubiquinone/menaquinone biosynthesis C-methylase UbiE
MLARQQTTVLWSVVAASAALALAQGPSANLRRAAAAEAPELARELELQPGMAVADVGAGSGAWSWELSQVVGPSGRVLATDIDARALANLRSLVERERLDNVTVIEGAGGATNLPDASCDAILIRDAYHHVTEPDSFSRSLFAALKPGGRLAIIDFAPDPRSRLPAGVPANRGGHGIAPAIVVSEMTAAGFAHVRTIPTWSRDARPGNELFLSLFRRP